MNQKSDLFVSLSVIISSALLLAALVFAVIGNPFEKPHLEFAVDFEDISGVSTNSEVRYAGSTIGVVREIEHLSVEERRHPDEIIRMNVAILEEIDIPANVKVSITSSSMLGERFVALKRVDDEEGLLAGGTILSASSAPSMLEDIAPGSSEIVANIDELVVTLNGVVAQLNGDSGKGLMTSVTNIEELTGSLKDVSADFSAAFSGDDEKPGMKGQIDEVLGNLESLSSGLNVLMVGEEGKEGINDGAKRIVTNLDAFSLELNKMICGTEDEAGLRTQLNNITEEIHVLLAGPEDKPEEALRQQLLGITSKVESLTQELHVMTVWGQYIAGTLAEKPNRLIFGNGTNDIPTKEELLDYIERKESYPVVIQPGNGRKDEGEMEKVNAQADDRAIRIFRKKKEGF
mgnify:CR=1 FL=1|tara:strand:+ start:313 stop:1521 length:1209 start_codon:yes stop_codon:yes gene_type:complete